MDGNNQHRMLRLYKLIKFIPLLLIISTMAVPIRIAHAEDITAYDLIASVNELRASYGLAPYKVDPWLMNYAQEHANYMAANDIWTHRHSDGRLPWEIGIQENMGNISKTTVEEFMSVDTIVQSWRESEGHLKTMIGYSTGSIGAGVASNDYSVYATIDVRPGDGPVQIIPTSVALVGTPNNSNFLQETQWVVHTVKSGETVWRIAENYGVTDYDIIVLNMLSGENMIYPGEKLLIPITITPVLTATLTIVPEAPTAIETDSPTLVQIYTLPSEFPTQEISQSKGSDHNVFLLALILILPLVLVVFRHGRHK